MIFLKISIFSTMRATDKLIEVLRTMRKVRRSEYALSLRHGLDEWFVAKHLGDVKRVVILQLAKGKFSIVLFHTGIDSGPNPKPSATRYWYFEQDKDDETCFGGNQEGMIDLEYNFPETLDGFSAFRQGEYYAHWAFMG